LASWPNVNPAFTAVQGPSIHTVKVPAVALLNVLSARRLEQTERDLQIGEYVADLGGVNLEAVVVSHRASHLSPVTDSGCVIALFHSRRSSRFLLPNKRFEERMAGAVVDATTYACWDARPGALQDADR
jgi:hypothetical protein